MTVILMILKGIGIAVLVILGLFLTGVLAVAFVPVYYRADGDWGRRLTASAQITWLLHFLNVRIFCEKELTVQVRICGVRVFPKTGRKQKKSACQRQDSLSEPVPEADRIQKIPEPDEELNKKQRGRLPEAGSTLKNQGMSDTQRTTDAQDIPESRENTGSSTSGKQNRFFSFNPFVEQFRTAFRKLRDSLRDIHSTAKRLYARFVSYKAIWDREETQRAFHLASAQLHKVLRHVLPRRMKVYAAVGTDDPALTGQILAVQGILYPWLGDKVQIVPDFEEKRFEGEFHFKGQIRAGALGFYGLRLMLDRDVRCLIAILRGRTADKEEHNGRKQG